MNFQLQPTLQDERILLQPLKPSDFEILYIVASDPLIWEQHPQKDRWQRPVFEAFFQGALDSGGAFLVLDNALGSVIGCTRYAGLDPALSRIEIGWTFLARSYWDGHFNRSMKTLLLDHAFQFVETVVFFVHQNNLRSQRAMEKIGGIRTEMRPEDRTDSRLAESLQFLITKRDWEERAS